MSVKNYRTKTKFEFNQYITMTHPYINQSTELLTGFDVLNFFLISKICDHICILFVIRILALFRQEFRKKPRINHVG